MKKLVIFLSFVLLFGFIACDDTEKTANPYPSLTSLSPDSKVINSASFTLTATGSNFVNGSTIFFNGQPKNTTFISETELQCEIGTNEVQADFLTDGSSLIANDLSEEIDVYVSNPAPGGGNSLILPFSIKSNYTFTDVEKVTDNGEVSTFVPAILNDELYFVFMKEFEASSAWNLPVFFKKSLDNGSTWSQTERINSNGDTVGIAGFAASEDTLYLFEYDQNYNFSYSTSKDGGATWSTSVDIQANNAGRYMASFVYITEDNKILDFSLSYNFKLFPTLRYYYSLYLKVFDGTSWSETSVVIDRSINEICYPAAFLDNDDNFVLFFIKRNLFTASTSNDYYRVESLDNGATWSSPQDLSGTELGTIAGNLILKYLDDGDLLAVWQQNTPLLSTPEPRSIKVSTPEFKALMKKSEKFTHCNEPRNLALSAGEINISTSPDNGKTWETPWTLMFDEISQHIVTGLDIDSMNNLNLTTFALDENFSLGNIFGNSYYLRSTDMGQTWTQPIQLNSNLDSGAYLLLNSSGEPNVFFYYLTELSQLVFDADVAFSSAAQ